MEEHLHSLLIFLRFVSIIYGCSRFEFVANDGCYMPFSGTYTSLAEKHPRLNKDGLFSSDFHTAELVCTDDESEPHKLGLLPPTLSEDDPDAKKPDGLLGQALALASHRSTELIDTLHLAIKTSVGQSHDYDSGIHKFIGEVQSFFHHICNNLGEVKSQNLHTHDKKWSSEEWKWHKPKGKLWFSEWPDGQHPLSTTWPWTIRPSLAVLWGVCWKFFDRPRSAGAVPFERFASRDSGFWDFFPNAPPGANRFTSIVAVPPAESEMAVDGGVGNVAGAANLVASEPEEPFGFLTAPASPLDLTQPFSHAHSQLPTYPHSQGIATAVVASAFPQATFGFDNLFDGNSAPSNPWNPPNNNAQTYTSPWPNSIGNNAYSHIGNFGINFQAPRLGNTRATGNSSRQTPAISISPPISQPSTFFAQSTNTSAPHSAPSSAHPFQQRRMSSELPKGGPPTPHSEGPGVTPPPGQNNRRPSVASADDDSKDGGSSRKNVEPPRNASGKIVCNYPECSEMVFDRKCNWSKHMDKHERPYRCLENGCENRQGFTYSGGLLRHQREVHKKFSPKESLMCPYPYCKRNSGEGFTRRENLNEHIRRVHRPAKESPGESGNADEALPSDNIQPDLTQPDVQAAYIPSSNNVTPVKKTKKRKQRSQDEPADEPAPESFEPLELQREIKRLRTDNKKHVETISKLRGELDVKNIRINGLEQMITALTEHQQKPRAALAATGA